MEELTEIENDLLECEKVLAHFTDLLCKYKDEDNQKKLNDVLRDMKKDLDDQLKKIKKKDFEIAVVGREKAGKSSLLNAWIGFDLLPSDRNRCTYTSTEIRSCASISEQKYMIEYFTLNEFNNKLSKIAIGLHDGDSTDAFLKEEEHKEIEKYREKITALLDRKEEIRHFDSFEDVKGQLRTCITDPGHARAVKRIIIWTPKLSNKENVVLHDVPGYDSPITLHKEQTKAKIASVDAILYAKQFLNPDLVDCELEILRISDYNNPYIKAKDKIIVALTNCDQANSVVEYEMLVSKNRIAWQINEIPETRIIPVCSLAESKKSTTESEAVKSKLESLNNGQTGFKELKEAVNQCITNFRFVIARDRCDEIKNKIQEFFKKFIDCVKKDYDIDMGSQETECLREEDMDKIYSEWWAKKWKHIRERFQMFFNTEIIPKEDPDAPSCLNQNDILFKNRYEFIVEDIFRNIPATRKERQCVIYFGCANNGGIVAPKDANTKIRSELANEAINSLDKITNELNLILWLNIDKMISWIRKNLWNIPEIRQEIIGLNERIEMDMIKYQFDALIQRLARPATDIFLIFPRSRVERCRVMNEYQMELFIINKFIENGKIYDRGIIQFLANGKHKIFPLDLKIAQLSLDQKQEQSIIVINNEKERSDSVTSLNSGKLKLIENSKKDKAKEGFKSKLFGDKRNKSKSELITTELDNESEDAEFKIMDNIKNKSISYYENQFSRMEFSPDAETLEQVQTEIKEDLDEFIMCMKNSIFYGSGIQRFYQQELDRLRRKFIDLEHEKHRWFHLVFKYIKKQDPKVKIPAPTMADEIANRVRIINNIKNIKSIIDKF